MPDPTDTTARLPRSPALLFTGFEPSGDEHASHVVAELRRRHPDLPMYAWGGPRMEAAGCVLVERTGDDAVMGLPGLAKIRKHMRINRRIERWLRKNPVTVHIPVDSPAANDPICDIAKAHGCKVVHLVAPQVWAWGRWRVRALRRRTDMLLCLFDFEERFFHKRRVPARYVGHPMFDTPLDTDALDAAAQAFPAGRPRLAIMPGSRPDELERHFPLILGIFRGLRKLHPYASGVVACTSDATEARLRAIAHEHGGWPEALHAAVGQTDAVIRWCDLALVKSGTVTLQVARQHRPMVAFYRKSNSILYAVARLILATKFFSLPNVLAHKRVVPEFIPHYGGPEPIIKAAHHLLTNREAADKQRAALAEIVSHFRGSASSRAADVIEEIAGLRPPASEHAAQTAARTGSHAPSTPIPRHAT